MKEPNKKDSDTICVGDSIFKMLSMEERRNIKQYHGKLIKVITKNGSYEGTLKYYDLIDGRRGVSTVSDYKGFSINTLALMNNDEYKVYAQVESEK